MIKRVIKGWNAAPGAPQGWDADKDGDCGTLPIRVFPPGAAEGSVAVQWCESAWEPTPGELALLNQGHSLILRVVGWQVPVALYVDPVPQEAAAARPAGDFGGGS